MTSRKTPYRQDKKAAYRVSLINCYENVEKDFIECLGEDEIGSAVDAIIKAGGMNGNRVEVLRYMDWE